MHSDRYAEVTYCDDIRFEAGNKRSYMGVYASDLMVGSAPAVLNRLCISVRISTPVTRPFERLHLKISHGEKVLAEVPVDTEVLKAQMQQFMSEPAVRRLNFESEMFLSNLEISGPGKITVIAQTEAEELSGNALRLQVANQMDVPAGNFECISLGVRAERDQSLLQLELTMKSGQIVTIDFHGQKIADLRNEVTKAIQLVPGLIEWGGGKP